MIRAAVIGLGIGHAHCAGYLNSAHAELAAVCDLMPERLERVGGTFAAGSMEELKRLYEPGLLEKRWQEIGVRACASLEEILKDESIELVSLCTPDHTHAHLAVQILQSGRHLLLEKPLALTLADADAIGTALASSGSTLGVGYEFRLNPAIIQMRSLVDAGTIGNVEAFTLHHFRRPFKRDKWSAWIQAQETTGGLIVEETSHWLDLLRFLSGQEVERLRCDTSAAIHPDFDFEDIALIQGTLDRGAIFQISHALSGFDFSLNLTLHGRKGSIWTHLKDKPSSLLDGRQSRYCALVAWGDSNAGPGGAESRLYGEEATEPNTIRDFTMEFVRRVAEAEAPVVDFHDAYSALELALKARQAAAGGSKQ